MQRWEYGPEALAVWIGWADALGIFHDYENPPARRKYAFGGAVFMAAGNGAAADFPHHGPPDDVDGVTPAHFKGTGAVCRHQHG
jgi:hypothetical protein